MIMLPDPSLFVDHINHNYRDLRRCSLRVCTRVENSQNVRLSKNNRVGFKGVRKIRKAHKFIGKWRAIITANGFRYNLGVFASAEDAARAYDKAALRYHGEFACTNKMLGLLE
jgi:hypothetical protein